MQNSRIGAPELESSSTMSAGRASLNDTTVLHPVGVNSSKNDETGHLFHRIISVFLTKSGGEALIRPCPVLLGDGRKVDLLRLFVLVRDGGGYESVSRRGMWGSVLEKCGLEQGDVAPVKLVYFKYLYKFHRLLPAKMVAEFPHLLENGRGSGSALSKNCAKNIKDIMNNRKSMVSIGKVNSNGGYEKDHSEGKEFHGRKRWMDLSNLGDWIGDISQWVRGKRRRVDERREGFWDTPFTADLKNAVQAEQNRVDLRASPRSHHSSTLKPCSISKTTPPPAPPHTSELAIPRSRKELDAPKPKHVSVGPFYQACIPLWSVDVCCSDSKWLGSRIWPLPESRSQHDPPRPETDVLIGRGRRDWCGCLLPGSLCCFRFHIAERKMEMKQELGRSFYSFGFHEMGELVSLGWTEEEEKTLKKIAMSDLLENRTLSKAVQKLLPKKTRKQVVNYYFDVYITRQRGYQNRAEPENIDSDDEQHAGGSVDLPEGFDMVGDQ